MPTLLTRRAAAAATVLTGGLVVASAAAADAHSLDSSTLSVVLTDDSAGATVSVAADTLAALGVDDAAEVSGYLAEHLAVTGADGTEWAETWSEPVRETVDGIDSWTVDVAFDTAGAEPSSFTLGYDGVIEADSTHEAVVVLTDAAGDISTAGVLDASDSTLAIGDAASPGLLDMVHHGLVHVLEGADHLLFLVTLLLVAPLVARGGRWLRRDGVLPTLRRVAGVVTAFTLGHSLTLIASALGWVSLPSAPVEVLIAASVGVAAVHALRPLARNGELAVAGLFGLVHGLAFAGILADLGLAGASSVPSLLAFNLGVELAQLVTVALLFPSLYLISRTRFYPAVRVAGASVALAAATAWALDRLGLLANPFAAAEDWLVAHPWPVVLSLALLAAGCLAADRPSARAKVTAAP